MVVKVSGGRGGSCAGLVDYLEKQERGQWFSQAQEGMSAQVVTPSIDENKRNLGKEEEKFYQLIISPSQAELAHIGDDPAKLRDYTRAVMEEYARNFGKGIEGKDLIWFAKVEQERTHGPGDRSVQTGEASKGTKKEGEQTHVHLIVSRTEDLARFKAQQQAGQIDRKHPLKLSPATNHRATQRGAVKGGFDRTNFIRASEQQFDRQFGYERSPSETFDYSRTQQHGSQAERVAQRLTVIRSETQRREQDRQRAYAQRPAEHQAIEPVRPSDRPTEPSLDTPPRSPSPQPVIKPKRSVRKGRSRDEEQGHSL